ncbi:DUF3857 domain-containing protein [Nibribacter ruber]|uniref:DUF3857 domain-containing protein n=1 Tax=Nibribacter ruber TaxID=2698458 RepID=A0A6P1P154_9BACT|nr:DUF3857 domain-containing protein [Nibribacter ruber]QHL88278.1 DUF3857 domain-containing protein [Nibribacter ruber]
MKTYAPDTSAAAVVLYDYGQSSFIFTKGTQVQYKRTVRIKVLQKAGLEHANIIIPYYRQNRDNQEQVVEVKGFAYNLEGGKKVASKLDETAIFDEQVNANWYQKKLTLPNVKVGSVLEYTYTLTSDFLYNLREWEFQKDVPVKWSEYRVDMVPMFEYKQMVHGFHPFHLRESKESKVGVPINWHTERNTSFSTERGILYMTVTQYRWVMKDVPAFRQEAYLTNSTDYTSKIVFELAKVQYPDQEPRFMAVGWEDFTQEMLKEENFGKLLTSNPAYFKKVVQSLALEENADKLARLQAVYAYVQKHMQWDKRQRTTADDLKTAHEARTGSSADINLLLTALLREAGLVAQPMLVSTRNHGLPPGRTPMLNKFNYVISCVTLDGKDYLLDATEPSLAMGMLPYRCLNGKGWVVEEPAGRWVALQGLDRNTQLVSAKMEVKPTGEVTGTLEESYLGVPALQLRDKINSQGQEDYLKSLGNAGADWTWEQIKLTHLEEPAKPLKTSYQLQKTGEGKASEVLYLPAMLVHAKQENPFKAATRQYPVDFSTPIDETYVLQYQLPQGYEVEELPQPVNLLLPNGAAKFNYQAQVTNGKLQIISKLAINKTVFSPEEYASLREFFSLMVAKHAEKVVLRKKS